MKTLMLVLVFLASYAVVAEAGTFYPNKPSCRTTCYTDANGVTHCTTTCSGGYN